MVAFPLISVTQVLPSQWTQITYQRLSQGPLFPTCPPFIFPPIYLCTVASAPVVVHMYIFRTGLAALIVVVVLLSVATPRPLKLFTYCASFLPLVNCFFFCFHCIALHISILMYVALFYRFFIFFFAGVAEV
jgi:hypothetical protein